MLETSISVFIALLIGFGAGYRVREQVSRKECVDRRLFLAMGHS
jgi:hypothetical protein